MCVVYYFYPLKAFKEANCWIDLCFYCSFDDGDNISPKHVKFPQMNSVLLDLTEVTTDLIQH